MSQLNKERTDNGRRDNDRMDNSRTDNDRLDNDKMDNVRMDNDSMNNDRTPVAADLQNVPGGGTGGGPGSGINVGSLTAGASTASGSGMQRSMPDSAAVGGNVYINERNAEMSEVELNNKPPIMDQKGKQRDKEYEDLIKQVTPTHNLFCQVFHAFWTGGLICLLGQVIINTAIWFGADDKTAGSWCSFILILVSVLLTGFNLFGSIAKYAGAGILVPITGFANGITSSAIEFQKEGQVFGIGCKIFTIAGPVILYGLVSSWILGFLYWIF